ncbi:MAG: Rrf2 family transcriptional regulator [Epsilonproteobacteria bacterium]|nr:Rrf2 family transcriptional regulator [Campylobacterota bacterium]
MVRIKKNNLLVSIKGAHGGYKLAKKTEDIQVYEIITTLEDNFFQVECKTENPILKLYWQDAAQKFEQLFKIPLSDFEKYEQRMLGSLSYSI